MKTIIRNSSIVILLLFTTFTCSHAQTRDTTSIADQFAGTAVDTFYVQKTAAGVIVTNYSTRTVNIRNYGLNAPDTLVVWFNNDSTKMKLSIPPQGSWHGRLSLKSINTRCANGTLYRPFEVSENDNDLSTNTVNISTLPNNVITVVDSIVLPSVVAAYAANDVVTDSLTSSNKIFIFNNVVDVNGRGGIITSALLTADTNNVANGTFKLLIFYDTIPNVANNAAWVSSQTTNARFVGEIDFTLIANGSVTAYSYAPNLVIPFQCASDDKRLYGVLLAKAAYTHKQYGKIIPKLGIVRN